MALLHGLLFLRRDNDQVGVMDINGALFLMMLNFSVTSMYAVLNVSKLVTAREGWGVRARVFKVVDFRPLAPYRCEFESRQGLWIISCEEAIKLAYGTSEVLLMCPFLV